MKILSAKVYEYPEGVMNSPVLQILVDKLEENFIYTPKSLNGGTAYFAEKDGAVDFLFHNPTMETGYGGRYFNLTLENGEIAKVKGPWSSRPSVMGKLFGVDCMDVSITSDPEAFDRGYTFYSGHITLELARTANLPGFDIVPEEKYGEIHWHVKRVA